MQTHDSTPRDSPRPSDGRGVRYDTILIKSEGARLLSAYLGRPGRVQGTRLLWDCPRCGKEKISLQPASGAVGCWNAGCEVPDGTDVVGLIAHLEGLQTRGEDFKRVAALCYDLLGLPAPDSSGPNEAVVVPAPADKDSADGHTNGRTLVSSEHAANSLPASSPERRPENQETTDRVLRRLLELCPVEERDERLLASRGVALATAQAGRFGSISADRAAHVVERLEREFGRGELLNVPGFREDARHGGRLGFTLWGDFLLIPYLDGEGRVATIEGMAVGKVPKWAGKYTSLRNGGNHLYVFPGFRVEDLVAICEGPMGAIVAGQEGIPVGAIQGVKRYTAAGGHAPLPELASVDFGGRGILYVTDADVKPDAIADVEKHSPKACEWLIVHQNGAPRITTVPRIVPGAATAPKDLDEWILAAPEAGYCGVLQTLYSRSAAPEEWRGVNHAEDAEEAGPQIEDKVASAEGGDSDSGDTDSGDSEGGKGEMVGRGRRASQREGPRRQTESLQWRRWGRGWGRTFPGARRGLGAGVGGPARARGGNRSVVLPGSLHRLAAGAVRVATRPPGSRRCTWRNTGLTRLRCFCWDSGLAPPPGPQARPAPAPLGHQQLRHDKRRRS